MSDGFGSAINWLDSALGAAIGAAGLWLSTRLTGRAALLGVIHSGLLNLAEGRRQEQDRLLEQLRSERAEFAAAREELLTEIRDLRNMVSQLEAFIVKHALGSTQPRLEAPSKTT